MSADELPDLDHLDANGLREVIRDFVAARDKESEYSECLEEKLKALNSELAARCVEETDLEEQLSETQRANALAREAKAKEQQA